MFDYCFSIIYDIFMHAPHDGTSSRSFDSKHTRASFCLGRVVWGTLSLAHACDAQLAGTVSSEADKEAQQRQHLADVS